MQRVVPQPAGQRVIFSGIQPTGVPHLGNYVGALRQWVQLQNDELARRTAAHLNHQVKGSPKPAKGANDGPMAKLFFSIVDLHAITTPRSAEALRKARRETLASLLAVGIDPKRSTVFYQSAVAAHAELMWILSCTSSVGYLSRMTQWKQKMNLPDDAAMEQSTVGSRLKLGLFSYPVLQAADILVHRATHVPVGHDQAQHLEFARECVTNFNHLYGRHLVSPQTITPPIRRIMSLTDPTTKMSKSHPKEASRILITDTPEEIEAKIKAAVTDSIDGVSYDPEQRPGVSNLLEIFSAFDTDGRDAKELASDYRAVSMKQLKELVSKSVVQGLEGIRPRFLELMADDEGLDRIEIEGNGKARGSANMTMLIVKNAMGLAARPLANPL